MGFRIQPILLTIFLAWCPAGFAAITIAQEGTPACVVVVAKDARAPERLAADELVRFLGEVTGAEIPLVFSRQKGSSNLFVGPRLAKTADPRLSFDGLGEEGIIVKSVGEDLILAGTNPRSTLYAVYSFLEDSVGCHWWSDSASTIPSIPDLTIEELDVRYVPLLEYRDPQFKTTPQWAVRNRLNGFETSLTSREGGKKFRYIAHSKWSSHTFWTLLPPHVYFEEHPEFYSLIEGERAHSVPQTKHTSLCLTNDEMKKEFIRNCRLALNWHPWATLFSISQVDEGGEPNRCYCDSCSAVEAEDNPSGLILRFVNSVAAELKEGFPDMTFDTLAYHYSQKPPKHTRAREDVIIRLSSIGCSFNTPMFESRDDNPRHNQFSEDLVGWAEKSSRLYVWDYAVNFTYHPLPHPNLRTFGPNIRWMVEHNVKGLLEEAGTPAKEIPELRAWLLAQLMWDPYQDSQALIEEFCHGFYGPAADHVLAYLAGTHDAVEASGDYLGLSSPPDAKFLSIDLLDRSWRHVQAAAEAVSANPILRRRIENLEMSLLYAFFYRWEELQEDARTAGKDWPLSGTQTDVHEQIQTLARRQGMRLKQTSSPIPF
jgi:hypothetical protein